MSRLVRRGTVGGPAGEPFSFANCMNFSAETSTSLGFDDPTPVEPLRLVASVEALNAVLPIGCSASCASIATERFWGVQDNGYEGR